MNLQYLLNDIRFKESKQVGVLYHFTDWFGFIGMIKKQRIFPGMFDSISFTRNYNMGNMIPAYAKQKKLVRFAFDGTKLSDKYKIVPFIDNNDVQIQRKYHNSKDVFPIHSENEEKIEVDGDTLTTGSGIPLSPYLIQIDILESLLPVIGKTNEYVKELESVYSTVPISIVPTFRPIKGVYV